MKNITFNIPDLHCEGCADRSTNILERLEGVHKANVTFEDKTAKVEFDSDKASFEDIKVPLTKAGYTAEK